MRIAILTPLFPPDIGDPAPYVKLLSEKISSSDNDVTVFLYGHLPEQAGSAKFSTTDKRTRLGLRIILYFFKLLLTQHRYDLFIINNGPSTELPALFLAFFRRKSSILVISDPLAKKQETRKLYGAAHSVIKNNVASVIDITTAPERKQPEKHPFKPTPPGTLLNHTDWWRTHLQTILYYGT